MKTERQNFSNKRRIERIVVSKAGDMAYEFGYTDLSWDTPEKKHICFEASYLRVWRKINGEWKKRKYILHGQTISRQLVKQQLGKNKY